MRYYSPKTNEHSILFSKPISAWKLSNICSTKSRSFTLNALPTPTSVTLRQILLIVQKVHCSGPLQAVYASLHILRRDLLPAFYFYCLLFFHLWPEIRELKFPLAKILLLHVLIEKSIYCFNIAGY